ncbi:AhpC/TSA family protein [Prosthecobacter fusiformis]|uniref:AhpC/TSA family protein n=1 Tax=Prosthecobacter fusiformis TaxID=48464 RepID=A0A4R7RIT3_9BACT|nr:peroxiredoxin family protein [Prosthecobacter fusiformis]TDU64047.1 AhpC/TSA family protein [Prosthecobacter fusiformis]
MHLRFSAFVFFSAALVCAAADPLPGHSLHGEAFNEGPRQAAVLMPGTGKVDFKISTKNAEAQKFFNQGVGQLHGFWYYEAERSFRQVAVLDKECAMAFWGMAMANVNNEKRAKEFVKKAVALKDKAEAREKLWLATLENFYKEDKRDKKQRALDFIRDLETIVQEHPEDVEAKAFLAWKIWHAKDVAPMSSPQVVDMLLDQVFVANPEHPAHHYRIHLWDGSKPARAVKSAAQNGQSAPGIAHMWHMPGHTFSKLKRPDDAAWQQEASTRADHEYMRQNWVLPDQIHNYAHNEEWLVRTFNELGRAQEAEALARSLITNPRHPKYNTLDKGSANYGRTRLIETLIKWERWEELLAVTDGPFITAVDHAQHEVTRRHARGLAFYHQGDVKSLDINIAHLEQWQAKIKKAEAKKKGEKKAGPPAKGGKKPDAAAEAVAELRALKAILMGAKDAAKKLQAATGMPKERAAPLWLKLGGQTQAEACLKGMSEELYGLAVKTEVQAALGKTEDAKKTLKQVGKLAFAMDKDLPVAMRLDALAVTLGTGKEWREAAPKHEDSGVRPALDTLGPMHWQPPAAPPWEALTLEGQPVTAAAFEGKPHVLLFYLGSACGHCMTQINAFAKVAPDYEKAGIQLAAVTLEPVSLAGRISEQMSTGKLPPFPIYCDPGLAMFKSFKAYDDFEDEPLHAAVLVDAEGRVRWWDVSWEPFTDTAFLLEESRRLLDMK